MSIKQDIDLSKVNEMKKEDIDKVYVPYMYLRYTQEVVPKLKKDFNLKSDMQVPRIKKILISSNYSRKKDNCDQMLKKIHDGLYLLCGQKPFATRAKRSISQFKIYKGSHTGYKVCITGKKMYEFIENLIIYLTNIKDFRGHSEQSVTEQCFSFGIRDMQIVPIISKYLGLHTFGATITIVATNITKDKKLMLAMLREMHMPIYLK